MVPIACVLLTDERGWVLLMERDEHAPRAPEQWGLVGGHVEPGEDFATAVRRELEEETGLTEADLAGPLQEWRHESHELRDGTVFDMSVWCAPTTLTDADIVLGEGRQIVFVEPARVADLDLAESAERYVPLFLSSNAYQELTR